MAPYHLTRGTAPAAQAEMTTGWKGGGGRGWVPDNWQGLSCLHPTQVLDKQLEFLACIFKHAIDFCRCEHQSWQAASESWQEWLLVCRQVSFTQGFG